MDAIKLLGALMGNNAMGRGVGGNLIGSMLGGGGGGGGGMAGNILGAALGGGNRGGGGGGGLAGNLIGSLLGGRNRGGGGGGMAGNLISSMLGGGGGNRGGAGGGLLGGVAGAALSGFMKQKGGDEVQQHEIVQQNHLQDIQQDDAQNQAELFIRAMCNAAKSDGQVDEQEQQNIIGRLGAEVDENEIAFLKHELAQPLDVNAFANSVPKQIAPQVYAMSVMAIELDNQTEAQYLGQLAQGLGLDGQTCNQIHEEMGAPKIFS